MNPACSPLQVQVSLSCLSPSLLGYPLDSDFYSPVSERGKALDLGLFVLPNRPQWKGAPTTPGFPNYLVMVLKTSGGFDLSWFCRPSAYTSTLPLDEVRHDGSVGRLPGRCDDGAVFLGIWSISEWSLRLNLLELTAIHFGLLPSRRCSRGRLSPSSSTTRRLFRAFSNRTEHTHRPSTPRHRPF